MIARGSKCCDSSRLEYLDMVVDKSRLKHDIYRPGTLLSKDDFYSRWQCFASQEALRTSVVLLLALDTRVKNL